MSTQKPFWKTIFLAGIVAGFLDILAATVQYYLNTGNGPENIFRYIASAIFGRSAFTGGSGMIVIGLLLHFLIAFIFAALYVSLYDRIKKLKTNTILNGVVFGIGVWFVMNKIVLPLSKVRVAPFDLAKAGLAMLIIVCMVGIPIAVITQLSFRTKRL